MNIIKLPQTSVINTRNKGLLIALSLGFLLIYQILGDFLTDPNGHMFAYGGDAFVIYYDVMYHTCFGNGTTLTAMNYPYGEYLYMTDAQGQLSYVLQWIHQNLFEVCDYVLGIIHFLNVYLLFIGITLVYLLLTRLNVTWWLAGIFAPLIIMLSPQIVRLGGHFGLAYPFIIPLTLLWYLRKERIPYLEWRDFLICIVLLLFTFNNPYIGFVAVFPLLILGGLRIFFGGANKFKIASIVLGMALLVLAIPFITFKLNDIVTDRIKIQWGFFFYNTSIEGLIYPYGSPIYDLLINWGFEPLLADSEKKQYLGISNIIILTIGFIWFLFKFFKNSVKSFVMNHELKLFVLSSAVIFFLTSQYLWNNINEDWIESYLGFILMFKAIARLNWAFYFFSSIIAIVFLNKFVQNYRKLGIITTFILASLWVFDFQKYIVPNFNNSVYPNFINEEALNELTTLSNHYKIDTANYQAILVLPKMMAWNDNLLSNIHFNSQHYSMKLSLANGLPLISSMLSRMSISQAAEAIQLLSHPWIKKELAYKLPNKKPILLMLGKDHPKLEYGEHYLTTLGDTLIDNNNFTLWTLPIEKLQQEYTRKNLIELSTKNIPKSNFVYKDFNDMPRVENKASNVLFGNGLKFVSKGQNIILDTVLNQGGEVELSIWVYLDHQRHGMGTIHIEAKDSLGVTYMKTDIDPRSSNDIDQLWLRTNHRWKNKEKSKIKLIYISDKNTALDELLIRSVQDTVYQIFDGKVSANGYNIK